MNLRITLLVFIGISMVFPFVWAYPPQHMSSYPWCYTTNNSQTNCTDGWTEDYYMDYVYVHCGESNYNYCEYECSLTTYVSHSCYIQNSSLMLWWSRAYDGNTSEVRHYWCTDSNSVIYSCGYGGCSCPSYCGDGSCGYGEQCVTDCSYEVYCSDGYDNDEDWYTDSSDSDCGYCGDYTCQNYEYCPQDCYNEYWCSDAIDNDGNGCVDYSDHYCGGTETSCSDGNDNDCDGLTDSADSECPQDVGGYCGDWMCSGNETTSSCPNDCCEWDCTSKNDNICHYECNGYMGCSMPDMCNNLIAGRHCYSSSHYMECCYGNIIACNSNLYCNNGYCIPCSTQCDGSCQSFDCMSDPDCTKECGDGCCASGETCPEDCGTGLCEGVTCEDRGSCIWSHCNSETGKCEYDDVIPCCGNGECEPGESSVTCPEDCYVEGELRLWIIYPNNGTTYFRGNVTQISAQLNYGSQVVNDGEVSCLGPSGGYFNLEFGASLYYTYDYSIRRGDPSGIWEMRCNATASIDGEEKHDSDYVMLEIEDRLVINLGELNDFYFQGDEIRLQVNVSYDNGTAATGVEMVARTPEGNVTLEEIGGGMYELSYVMNSLGNVNISLAAVDLTGTTTFTGVSILSVKPLNPMDYVWLIPVALVSGVVLFFGRRRMIRMKMEKGLENEIISKQNRMTEINAEKKRLQDEFLQTRITEIGFKERMKALDTEYQRIDLDLKELNKKGPST